MEKLYRKDSKGNFIEINIEDLTRFVKWPSTRDSDEEVIKTIKAMKNIFPPIVSGKASIELLKKMSHTSPVSYMPAEEEKTFIGIDFAEDCSNSLGLGERTAEAFRGLLVDRRMAVQDLFAMQQKLDNVIIDNMVFKHSKEHLFNDKIMATMVELGEMSNEYRGFKYWSKKGPDMGRTKEEYIDVLHFVLSMGNDLFDNVNELLKAYVDKNIINYQRQKENY